jgi:hypothetical protein
MTDRRILIVDDNADDERAKLGEWKQSATLVFRHPQDVTIDDLQAAQVVVVDFRLDDLWPERDERDCIALKPMNGLALLQVLKSHEIRLERSPTAFVLRSAHLEDLTSGKSPDTRLHSIARQHGLEWVLEKTSENPRLANQLTLILSLADAVADLPEKWPTDNREIAIDLFRKWLRIPETTWQALAWQDIEDCHPPVHELAKHRDGMRLVRWMAQRILPYPCFLMNESRLAARLKVTLVSLKEGLANGLKEFLQSAEYTGALHGFFGGPFWWRSGVESVLWQLSDGRSFETSFVFDLLNSRCGNRLERSVVGQPVLCLDDTLGWLPDPVDITEAVRIQPDDWPVFAEQAWARLVDAREHPQLGTAVIAADRHRLYTESGENE